jgi:hypothetical protein
MPPAASIICNRGAVSACSRWSSADVGSWSVDRKNDAIALASVCNTYDNVRPVKYSTIAIATHIIVARLGNQSKPLQAEE